MKNGQLAKDYRWNWNGKLKTCRHCKDTFWADPRTREACLKPECQALEAEHQRETHIKANRRSRRVKRIEAVVKRVMARRAK